MAKHLNRRLWEIDIIRFLALCLMVVQHVTIIWLYVKNFQLLGYPGYINLIGRAGALLFLFLVGFSGYLSYSKREFSTDFFVLQNYFFLRGLAILGWGMLLSLVTWFLIPEKTIWFGVLHFIGMAVITLPFFIKFKLLSRVFILVSVIVGVLAIELRPQTLWLLPLGFAPIAFNSLDYWPYFPWISIVLTGLEVARYVFDKKYLGETLFSKTMPAVLRPLQYMGSHTLLIYIVHAPILAIIFWLIRHYLNI